MNTYCGSVSISPPIINLGTRWRLVIASHPGLLSPGERLPDTHWIGAWVGLIASLNAVAKRRNPSIVLAPN
jgi:hypothetical protein